MTLRSRLEGGTTCTGPDRWLRITCVVWAGLLAASLAAALPALASSSAEVPRTRDAFATEFRRAFASGELDETLPLFYWQGVDEWSRDAVRELIRADLGKTLLRLEWLPAPTTPERERLPEGLRSNLPVEARLLAAFLDDQGRLSVSMHEVGRKDGVYYIVLAARAPLQATARIIFARGESPLNPAL